MRTGTRKPNFSAMLDEIRSTNTLIFAKVKFFAEYLADPGLRTAHADAARRTMFESFSLTAMAAKYQEVCESLLPTQLKGA